MIFRHSAPEYQYRDFRRYRKLLRSDFQYRSAYCLTKEYSLGGETNFTIDHYYPRGGKYGRPDLAEVYENLYWTCRECNENKSEYWPSPDEELLGFKWINPCESWGNHDSHWIVYSDGSIKWLTPVGEYTISRLRLDQREWLKRHWQQLYQGQAEHTALLHLLESKQLPAELQIRLDSQLQILNELLNPQIYARPRSND